MNPAHAGGSAPPGAGPVAVRLDPALAGALGRVADRGARDAAATLIERVAAQLARTEHGVAFARCDELVELDGEALHIACIVIRDGDPPEADEHPLDTILERAFAKASGGALRHGPVLCRVQVDGWPFVGLVAWLDDPAAVERVQGEGALVEAVREVVHECFRALWAAPYGEGKLATLPAPGAAEQDPEGYAERLRQWLGPAVLVSVETLNQTYVRLADGPLRELCPDLGARGDARLLALYSTSGPVDETTRAALLFGLVDASLEALRASDAHDGTMLCVGTRDVSGNPDLASHVTPAGEEEHLWTFVAYVAEPWGQGEDAERAGAIEQAVAAIEPARWWSPGTRRLRSEPCVALATDPTTARRYYCAGAVLSSTAACRRWADSDAVAALIGFDPDDRAVH